jgi:hypothetical protein
MCTKDFIASKNKMVCDSCQVKAGVTQFNNAALTERDKKIKEIQDLELLLDNPKPSHKWKIISKGKCDA